MIETVLPNKNYFVVGTFKEGNIDNYLVVDVFTKTLYAGKGGNGTMNLEKLTPDRYLSLFSEKEEIDMFPGFLVPDKKDDSILFAAKWINFERAIPKNYPVE